MTRYAYDTDVHHTHLLKLVCHLKLVTTVLKVKVWLIQQYLSCIRFVSMTYFDSKAAPTN